MQATNALIVGLFVLLQVFASDCDTLGGTFPKAKIPSGLNCCSSYEGIQCDSKGRISGLYIDASINSNFSLVGQFPEQFGDLTEITALQIVFVAVNSTFPLSICKMRKLENLVVARNKFSNGIPECLFELPSLTDLNLVNNELTGNIPSNIGNAKRLETLYLDNNNLSGTIPKSITSLNSLRDLQFSGNQISGELSPDIGSMTNLNTLVCSGNDLWGELPKSMASLSNWYIL